MKDLKGLIFINITSYLKIILVVLMNTQVEAIQESFQHDINESFELRVNYSILPLFGEDFKREWG